MKAIRDKNWKNLAFRGTYASRSIVSMLSTRLISFGPNFANGLAFSARRPAQNRVPIFVAPCVAGSAIGVDQENRPAPNSLSNTRRGFDSGIIGVAGDRHARLY